MVVDDCFGEWSGRIGHFQAKSTDFFVLFQKLIRKSLMTTCRPEKLRDERRSALNDETKSRFASLFGKV